MPPSQLKQLKASIRDRREANGKKQAQPNVQSQQRSQRQLPKKKPKSQGEQNRRATLLAELQRRHKAGGIIDRRIGENDPTMAPEERALQRFTRQRSKRDSMFNLEEADGEDQLTHLGRSVLAGMDGNLRDDFEEDDLGLDDEQNDFMTRAPKRRRISNEDEDNVADGADSENQPERKKSKKEVMEEVMAKSKFHKYERQQAKDEDEEVRETLDKDLPDLLAILRGGVVPKNQTLIWGNGPLVHPERAAQVAGDLGATKDAAEKEYDLRLRQMAQDKRAQPTERTKTEEEKAETEAARLRELEDKRMRRMRGEEVNSDDGDDPDDEEETGDFDGLQAGTFDPELHAETEGSPLDVEDEDDFVIDEDLVANASDIDTDISESSSLGDDDEALGNEDAEDDSDFLRDVLPDQKSNSGRINGESVETGKPADLPYTYACPQTHSEFLNVVEGVPFSELPTVIQRIRALYHPQLNAQNNERLSRFAVALVDHLAFIASQKAPLEVVENLIRHIHSLSKKYADAIAKAFRTHLSHMQRRLTMTSGDLFILTAIGSIFPTSDHFHQVVTPAITIIARWLGMNSSQTDQDSVTGAYLVALAVRYQTLSRRYVPEALRFTIAALKRDKKSANIQSHITNLTLMMDLWSDKVAFLEIFSPEARDVLDNTRDAAVAKKLRILLAQSQMRRRPLELHHHRPLPIRSAIPKFEEGFNPDKHYDPDRERAESNKLRKEYKREKKGALRELKKDASFIAREKLKAKKEADRAYEIKQRRLIAEIQGEEGNEKNAYEREKRKRKGIR